MLTIILALILISFLQNTLVPVDLVMLVLISRSFLIDEKLNYYLAFFLGLLISFLSSSSLGGVSLIYLCLVMLISIFRKTQFATYWLVIVPATLVLASLTQFLEMFLMGHKFNLSVVIWQIVLILPIYLLIKFWEERFIPKKDIKLKYHET